MTEVLEPSDLLFLSDHQVNDLIIAFSAGRMFLCLYFVFLFFFYLSINKIAAAFKKISIILLHYWLIKGGSMLGLENGTKFVLWDDVSVEDVDVALEVKL